MSGQGRGWADQSRPKPSSTHSAPSTSCPLPHLPSHKGHSLSSWPINVVGEVGGPERAKGLPWGPQHAPDDSGLSGHCTPAQPTCLCPQGQLARARGGSLGLLCPSFADVEFCIIISILSLSVRIIIYSFFFVSVPRSPGCGPALLPRRPCQPVCLWEHLVPGLTGTNKEALFLTVWSAFVGRLGARIRPEEGGGDRPCRAVWTPSWRWR